MTEAIYKQSSRAAALAVRRDPAPGDRFAPTPPWSPGRAGRILLARMRRMRPTQAWLLACAVLVLVALPLGVLVAHKIGADQRRADLATLVDAMQRQELARRAAEPQAASSLSMSNPEAVTGPAIHYQPLTPEQARAWNAAVPSSTEPNPPASPFVLKSKDIFSYQRAVNCLAAAVYYEAASEGVTGQEAVAQVVVNRLRHPAFPKTVCGVVFEGAGLPTGCQFSFACDGSMLHRPSPLAWTRARNVAVSALDGFVETSVGHATHYHAVYVAPYWSPAMVKLRTIGGHVFYRWTDRTGPKSIMQASYAEPEPVITRMAVLLTPDSVATEPTSPGVAVGAQVSQPPAPLLIATAPIIARPLAVPTLPTPTVVPAIQHMATSPVRGTEDRQALRRRNHLPVPAGAP